LLDTPDPPAPLEFRSNFGNENPVEIEVGCGKGLFLVTTASAHPDVNFLGIEIVRKYQLFTATRLAKRNLTNVRMVCADARLFLRDCIRTESVQAIHVYFPDPWWKKRHHKRRLWTPEFAVQCERVLRPGGELHIATDVEDYFTVILSLIAAQKLLQPLPPPPLKEPGHDLDYLTNFERKSHQRGGPIFRGLYERIAFAA
jgi:tRNA (guanine-N7-)-methyltransferase